MTAGSDRWGSITPRSRDHIRSGEYALPTEIVFGPGSAKGLGDRLRQLGLQRPLIVTDQGVRAAGLVDQFLDPRHSSSSQVAVFDQVESDPSTTIVETVRDRLRSDQHDAVIGLGGRQHDRCGEGGGGVGHECRCAA